MYSNIPVGGSGKGESILLYNNETSILKNLMFSFAGKEGYIFLWIWGQVFPNEFIFAKDYISLIIFYL